ncbi:MAG: hypothetical protein LBB22_06705 [Treponema sp.]|jgi:hypothetical protein|nr:hypothetical protein [Treponema sp.]
MYRTAVLISVFILLSSTAYSLSYSTGYGLTLGANFDTLSTELNASTARQLYNQFNFGGLVFFDATYIIADISFYGTSTTFAHNETLKEFTNINEDYQLAGANLSFGVYVKYPFNVRNIIIFPILGINGSIGLAQNFARDFTAFNAKKNDSFGSALDWSTWIVKAGCGFDITLSSIMFFRAELLIDYKLNTPLDQAFIEAINKKYPDVTNMNLGFEFEFLLGYKIGQTTEYQSKGTSSPPARQRDDDIFYPK